MKTILITGCSSGYGLESARYFLSRDWNVIATMRTPREDALPRAQSLRILSLDVTDEKSIAAAIKAAGPIDVLVNNAGIGVVGAFEVTPLSHIRKVFETNTFGVMAMTQAVIPQMRERRSGVIVNVTSSTTLAPFPLAAAYTASKQAILGFTLRWLTSLGISTFMRSWSNPDTLRRRGSRRIPRFASKNSFRGPMPTSPLQFSQSLRDRL